LTLFGSSDTLAHHPKHGRRMSFRSIVKGLANRVPAAATVADFAMFKTMHNAFTARLSLERTDLARRVHEEGFAVVENYFTPEQCDRCIADMEWMFANKPEHVQYYSDVRVFGAEELSATIREFYGDPILLSFANHHIGRRTVNVFTLANKVEPRAGSLGSGEGWHKDASFRQFKAFVYLNDVTEENGPLQLVSKSHTLLQYLRDMKAADLPFRSLRISDLQLERIIESDRTRLRTITGKRGTLILADTACIHRGRPPVAGTRYALTNYYMDRQHLVEATADMYKPVSNEKVMRLWKFMHGHADKPD
jgi:hypothetical protein